MCSHAHRTDQHNQLLTGTILDPSGALIPGATVTLTNPATNPATNLVRNIQSGNAGAYAFDQILPGDYIVTVTAPGISKATRKVHLLVATPRTLNIKLSMGVTEVVRVDATSSEMSVQDASLGTAFNSQHVQTLPYQANNVLSHLSLQAGVLSLDPGAQNGGVNNGGPNGTQDQRTGAIDGPRQDQTNVTLDGVDNNDQNNGYASSQLIATQPIPTTGHHRYVAGGSGSYESVFANDTATSAANKLRFVYPGEAGQRNNFRADGYFDMDNGLAKDIHTLEGQNLRIEVEAFNVLNTVRFNALTTTYSSGSFGKYNSLLVNPRQLQFSAKYTF